MSARQNKLLNALPEAEFKHLAASLVKTQLPLGTVIFEAGRPVSYVLFPTSGIISLLSVLEDGSSSEIAMVGCEGVVGVSLFMGQASAPSRAVVQSVAAGYILPAATLGNEFARGGALQHLLLRYTQAMITQMSQTVVCNRHHSVDQQLCRWLLLSLDRLPGDDLVMTQDLIANMLGVRREGVTEAACKLQHAGAISYKRGRIHVVDRDVLEARSCECYRVVRRDTERLFSDVGKPRGEGGERERILPSPKRGGLATR